MRKDLKFTWNIPKMCCAHASEQYPFDWTLVWRVSNVFQSMLPKSDFPWREPPWFLFSVGDLWASTSCFCTNDDLVVTGNDLAKYTSWLQISILWLYDTCLFIACWNGSRKLRTSSVLFQSQMFPTLRFLNFIDRSDTLGHVFFRLILGRTLVLSLRPLASVVSFLGHEGTTFSLKLICSFSRFSFTTYGSTVYIVMHGRVFCSPFPMARSHIWSMLRLWVDFLRENFQLLGEDFYCTPGIPWNEGKFGHLGLAISTKKGFSLVNRFSLDQFFEIPSPKIDCCSSCLLRIPDYQVHDIEVSLPWLHRWNWPLPRALSRHFAVNSCVLTCR